MRIDLAKYLDNVNKEITKLNNNENEILIVNAGFINGYQQLI